MPQTASLFPDLPFEPEAHGSARSLPQASRAFKPLDFETVTYCAKQFSPDDILAIRALIAQNPKMVRQEISRQVCQMFAWLRPNGALKDMSARVAMLRMHADGLITLPPAKTTAPRRKPHFPSTPATDPELPLTCHVHQLPALKFLTPQRKAQSHLWNEYIARYHYLGYTPLAGAQWRFFFYAGAQLVALLSFGASAWKLSERDCFIGWNEAQRQRNLQLIVGNARLSLTPVDRGLGLGLEDLGHGGSPVAPGLATALRLQPCAARDLRRIPQA